MVEKTRRRVWPDKMGRKKLEDSSDAHLEPEEHIVLKPEELLVIRKVVDSCYVG